MSETFRFLTRPILVLRDGECMNERFIVKSCQIAKISAKKEQRHEKQNLYIVVASKLQQNVPKTKKS